MGYESKGEAFGNVENLPSQIETAFITQELERIAELARSLCPQDSEISFSFDRKLLIHLDIRSLEDVTRAEVMLSVRGAGLFSEIQRRPNRTRRSSIASARACIARARWSGPAPSLASAP